MLSYYRYQEHEWVGVRGWHQRETWESYGWLVSKSKLSGHLPAGTDDTATARHEAIILSLVAEPLFEKNGDIQGLLTAHTNTVKQNYWQFQRRISWTDSWYIIIHA